MASNVPSGATYTSAPCLGDIGAGDTLQRGADAAGRCQVHDMQLVLRVVSSGPRLLDHQGAAAVGEDVQPRGSGPRLLGRGIVTTSSGGPPPPGTRRTIWSLPT